MAGPLDFLNPVKGIVNTVTGVIDQFVESDEDKLKAKQQILDAESEARRQILEYEAQRAHEAAKTVRAEVASDHWLAANWRPILMLTFTYIIAHNFVLAPVFGLVVLEIPTDMWSLMKIGVGGYVVGRSAERIVPNSKWGRQNG